MMLKKWLRGSVVIRLVVMIGFFLVSREYEVIRTGVIVASIACLLVSRDWIAKTALAIAVLFGFIPLLGWIPGASRLLDPVLLWSASLIVLTQFPTQIQQVKYTMLAVPVLVVVIATWWTWRWYAYGSPADQLSRLITGWDNFGHLYLFREASRDDSFLIMAARPENFGTPLNEYYPAGLHFLWHQVLSVKSDLGNLRSSISTYAQLIVVNLAVACGVFCLAIMNLAKGTRFLLWSSLFAAPLSFLLFAFGPFAMTLWVGFPNFVIVLAFAGLIASLVVNPLSSTLTTSVVLGALFTFVSYNWHPVLLVLAPVLVISEVKRIREMSSTERKLALLVWLASLVASAAPVLLTLRLGVEHVTLDGGIPPIAPSTVIVVIGIAVCMVFLVDENEDSRVKGLRILALSVVSVQLALSITIRVIRGSYPYYVQKYAYASVVLALVVVSCLIVLKVEREGQRRRLLLTAPVLAFLVSQMFGYIGPDWRTVAPFSTQAGLTVKVPLTTQSAVALRPANIVFSLSEFDISLKESDSLVYADTDMQSYDPVLMNYWVGVAANHMTSERLARAQELTNLLTGVSDPKTNALHFNSIFDPGEDGLLVTRHVADELVLMNNRWRHALWIIKDDGHISRYLDAN